VDIDHEGLGQTKGDETVAIAVGEAPEGDRQIALANAAVRGVSDLLEHGEDERPQIIVVWFLVDRKQMAETNGVWG
jgi:hypothetical protein